MIFIGDYELKSNDTLPMGNGTISEVWVGDEQVWPMDPLTTEIVIQVDPNRANLPTYDVVKMTGTGRYEIDWDYTGAHDLEEGTLTSASYTIVPHTYSSDGLKTINIKATAGITNINFDAGSTEERATIKKIIKVQSSSEFSLQSMFANQGRFANKGLYGLGQAAFQNFNTFKFETPLSTNFAYVFYRALAGDVDSTTFVSTGAIPPMLFSECTAMYQNFTSSFESCRFDANGIPGILFSGLEPAWLSDTFKDTNITSLPADLLTNMVSIGRLIGTFSSCIRLTAIPTGFFGTQANPKRVYNVANMFLNCESLVTVPNGLFDYCEQIYLGGVFCGCYALNADINQMFPQTSYPLIVNIGLQDAGSNPWTVSNPPMFGAWNNDPTNTCSTANTLTASGVQGNVKEFIAKFPNLIIANNPATGLPTTRCFYQCLNVDITGLTDDEKQAWLYC
ncbi:hypothetical protein AGMMS50239_36670 [Bacteroidia bacterium]|nr:hypothetical protein AGMMS50239_36670 [Bacteroidia bacterium]